MKQIYRHSIAASLFFMSTLLLCLISCQSSDNTEAVEGAMVASLPLKAQIGDISSRVGMTDIYGGAFNCYWNLDKLNIYHKYVLSGAVQSMTPLEFTTGSTSGALATFSYTGGAYRYNPGSRLYAFSKGTSRGYVASVTDAGVSTLTAALANQLGTLSDCAKYDALYGSANVNFSTGLPESLTMHHLFGMLNLHLTSSTFSTSCPVTVALTSSVSNILPSNGGNASLAADGSTLTSSGSGRWSTSWSATVMPKTNGVVDVYLMTWPFSSINGTLTVSCSDGSYNAYVDRVVTLSGFSLAATQLKSKPLAITNIPPNTTYSKLYAWDATDSQPVTLGTVPTNANYTPVASNSTDYSKRATHACVNCPNGYAITWYLSVPCYWDNGSIKGGNITNYKMANGSYIKAGMWFKKKSGITNFSSTASSGTTTRTPIILTDGTVPANLKSDYFFLPAAGASHPTTGVFSGGGTGGSYWLSTPGTNTSVACGLFFTSGRATFDTNYTRADGMCRWLLQ